MKRKMDYFLKVAALGKQTIMPIEERDYLAIKNARLTLSAALSVEEKYDLALSNFLELEKELLALTIEETIRQNFDYNHIYLLRSSLNRHMVNLLTAGRMYLEQIASDAAACVSGKVEIKTEITRLKNNQYDQSLDYRVMEALRNHVQHSGMALHTLSLPAQWTDEKDISSRQLEYNIDIYAEKRILAENPKFKGSTLKKMPDRFDLKKAARSYIGSISLIQEEIRKLTGKHVAEARQTIENYRNNYKDLNGGNAFAVAAYERSNDGTDQETTKPIMMMLDWDDVRIRLSEKNHSITNMHKRYTTNKINRK